MANNHRLQWTPSQGQLSPKLRCDSFCLLTELFMLPFGQLPLPNIPQQVFFLRTTDVVVQSCKTQNLLNLIWQKGGNALDIGARDGFFSVKLTDYFDTVVALDLEKPVITHERIITVQGDIRKLDFPANTFDLVLCAEVLEHIPSSALKQACDELTRVTKKIL